jgi:hypothetical protein
MADKKQKHSKNDRGAGGRGMDLGRLLLWAAVIVSAPRWAGAMLAADVSHIEGWLSAFLNAANTISGLGMGVLEVIATAYLLDALRSHKPTITHHRRSGDVVTANWRFYGILIFAAGLLAMTPMVLAPYMVSRMVGMDIGGALETRPWQYVWSIVVVIVPVFVVGGVAFAQSGLVTIGKAAGATQVAEPALQVAREAQPRGKVAESRERYGSWKSLPAGERLKVARMNVQEVQESYGVPERTAYDWLKYARRDQGVVGEVTKFEDDLAGGEQ